MSSFWQTMPNPQLFKEAVGKLIKNQLIYNIQEQGHSYTGKLEESIRVEAVEQGNELDFNCYMADYGLIVDSGIKPERIPYGGDSTGAETSQFIQALYDYAVGKLGVSTDGAMEAAHRIAQAMKNEVGMPTLGSFKFSKNGNRTGFIRDALEELRPKLANYFNQATRQVLGFLVTEAYKETLKFS